MKLTPCVDRKDGLRWECRKYGNKKHRTERSIRKGSWFDNSNLSLQETLTLTYWWCEGLTEAQISRQLGLGSHTIVDWDMFCRETCEVTLENELSTNKIGGPGKIVQIDESKIGKRKYYKGHRVPRSVGIWWNRARLYKMFHCYRRRS